MRRLTACATAVLVLHAAACGSTSRPAPSRPVILNTEKVERSVEQSIKDQRHLDASVSCPANVEQRKGNTFTCTATVAGKGYPVTVSQVDGQGHVQYVVR